MNETCNFSEEIRALKNDTHFLHLHFTRDDNVFIFFRQPIIEIVTLNKAEFQKQSLQLGNTLSTKFKMSMRTKGFFMQIRSGIKITILRTYGNFFLG